MNTLTFNNITLHSISRSDNQIWLTSADLAKALGYVDEKSVNRIFSRNKEEFTTNMTQVVEGVNLTPTAKTKGFAAKTRIFSLRGCHLLAMFARTKVAKEFRHWVLDVLDNKVGTPVIENEELPSSVKDRNGLVKAARITQYKLGIGYDDVFSLINHRFNVDRVGDLTARQVGEATEYIQRMRYPQLTETAHTEPEQDAPPITDDPDDPIEQGSATKMAGQVLASGKFVGTIDHKGRMAMRELDAEEVIITVDMIPQLIASRKINVNVLSRIALNANQQLYAATYGLRPTQNAALAQGEYHDSI